MVPHSDVISLERNPSPENEEENFFSSPEEKLKHLQNQSFRQDINERKKFAKRSFIITCIWITFIMLCTATQFVLESLHIGLDRYEFITVIITTSASVLGFWLLVGRYLFNQPIVGRSPTVANPPPNRVPRAP